MIARVIPGRQNDPTKSQMSRRGALLISSSSLVSSGMMASFCRGVQADEKRSNASNQGCSLGFSTYGMPSLKSEKAIEILSGIGFDTVELVVREGWDADSAKLTVARKKSIRNCLVETPLRLTSLMEHVFPTTEKNQRLAIERLKLGSDVAHDLSPGMPPFLQTVLGSGDFDKSKSVLRDRLGQWVSLAEANQITIAIKPHRGGIVSQPSEAVWLFDQLGNPQRLKMVYDYSHYAFRNLPMEKTIELALPHIAHVAVKDVAQENDRFIFELPGEVGTIDFADLIRRLHDGGYRGDINCEVSSMVSKQPSYDAVTAAHLCYRNLSAAFERSGVGRSA